MNRNSNQEPYLEHDADVVCVNSDSEVVIEGLGCVPPGGIGWRMDGDGSRREDMILR